MEVGGEWPRNRQLRQGRRLFGSHTAPDPGRGRAEIKISKSLGRVAR